MAARMQCDQEDGQPAAFLLTDLGSGDTLAVCPEHWAVIITGMVTELAAMPTPAEAEAETTDGLDENPVTGGTEPITEDEPVPPKAASKAGKRK